MSYSEQTPIPESPMTSPVLHEVAVGEVAVHEAVIVELSLAPVAPAKPRPSVEERIAARRAARRHKREPNWREPEDAVLALYLDDIGKYQLLTAEEEIALSTTLQAGLSASATLQQADTLTSQERTDLEAKIAAGNEAQRQMINANLRLVVSLAKRYRTIAGDQNISDLISHGNFGLIHATEKFDPKMGFRFSTYATWWIRQSIGRGIDNSGRLVRIPTKTAQDIRTYRRFEREGLSPEEIAEFMDTTVDYVARLEVMNMTHDSLDRTVTEDADTTMYEFFADPHSQEGYDGVVDHMVAEGLTDEILQRMRTTFPSSHVAEFMAKYGIETGEPVTYRELEERSSLSRQSINNHIMAIRRWLRTNFGDRADEL